MEGEKFYLRVLLNHVKGPTGFDDLRTVNEITYQTFKEAAEWRGLLESDDSIRQCLLEATNIRMPTALRRLFTTLLVFFQPVRVQELWNEFYLYMVEDYSLISEAIEEFHTNKLLTNLKVLLLQHGKSIRDYDLPVSTRASDHNILIPRIINDELSIPIVDEEVTLVNRWPDSCV